MNNYTNPILKSKIGKIKKLIALLAVISFLISVAVFGGESDKMYVVNHEGERPEPFAAVENVCAWPNLARLPNGDIVALICNQPSHGRMPGDVECWVSEDDG